ncbi:hypothetical protein [Borreliella valaisiana]|uniref:Uncharacterized protein n=1 Tax=Borreliella valaisiana VS116 TaxID=445987 RepID=C0R970_BORVA|nr:hypothetical protein [Borreliella valaisiana]ACN52939.1 conserved hypothetical protein [Borreliella valaisiana VS116]
MKSYYSKKGVKSNKKRLKPKTEANQNQEEDQTQKIKNTLLDDLRNLIETASANRENLYKKRKKNLQTNME